MAAPHNNVGGRKDKLWRDALMVAVKRADGNDPRPFLARIAARCVESALGGDMQAIKEIGDRLDGKAVQATALTDADGNDIPVGVDVRIVKSSSGNT